MNRSLGWLIALLLISSIAVAHQEQGAHNDFFSREKPVELKQSALSVEGEIATPGPVELTKLPLRSVTVRQAGWDKYGKRFTGAYRYEGYSLFDILKDCKINKNNGKEFPPPTDLFLEIRDQAGHAVLVSWGEIFYARIPHRILVATRVAPIVPSKSRRIPTIPENSMLVCGDDLFAVRNLSLPSRIIVRSARVTIPIRRNMPFVVSQRIRIFKKDTLLGEVSSLDGFSGKDTSPCVFFGRGRGFHGFHDFSGRRLSSVLDRFINTSPEFVATGFLIVSSVDGYRVVLSAAEVFNRGDGNEFLLLSTGLCEEKGRWAIYPAPDFFSDRAVSGTNVIRVQQLETES